MNVGVAEPEKEFHVTLDSYRYTWKSVLGVRFVPLHCAVKLELVPEPNTQDGIGLILAKNGGSGIGGKKNEFDPVTKRKA